jgi:NAD(P)-dependent dehydrogenase (short-subunit alcohol dehydrogenase family)
VTVQTFHPDRYAGKVVLAVGGTTGIGAAVGDAFAALGAVVTLIGASVVECGTACASPRFRCRDAVVRGAGSCRGRAWAGRRSTGRCDK